MSLSDETTFHSPTIPRCECLIVELGIRPTLAKCQLCEAAPDMRYALTLALARIKDIERWGYLGPMPNVLDTIRAALDKAND